MKSLSHNPYDADLNKTFSWLLAKEAVLTYGITCRDEDGLVRMSAYYVDMRRNLVNTYRCLVTSHMPFSLRALTQYLWDPRLHAFGIMFTVTDEIDSHCTNFFLLFIGMFGKSITIEFLKALYTRQRNA